MICCVQGRVYTIKVFETKELELNGQYFSIRVTTSLLQRCKLHNGYSYLMSLSLV
jgi:hypothetical protein